MVNRVIGRRRRKRRAVNPNPKRSFAAAAVIQCVAEGRLREMFTFQKLVTINGFKIKYYVDVDIIH